MCWCFRHRYWHAFTERIKTQLDETQPIEKTNTMVWDDPLIGWSNVVKRDMAAKEKNEDCRRRRGRWSVALLLSCIPSSSAVSPRFSRSNSSSTAWKPTGTGMLKPQSAIAATQISFIIVHLPKYSGSLSNPTTTVQHDYSMLSLCSRSHLEANMYRTAHAPEASDRCQNLAPADVRSSAPSPCYRHPP